MIWLRRNGCPWDEDTFVCAVRLVNLEKMTWLLENDCPWNISTFWGAYRHQNQELLEWIKEQYHLFKDLNQMQHSIRFIFMHALKL